MYVYDIRMVYYIKSICNAQHIMAIMAFRPQSPVWCVYVCVWQCTAYVSITCNGVCVLGFGTCVDNLIKIRQCWFDTIYFDSIVDTHIMWIEQCSMSTNKSLSHWWTEKLKINVDVKNLSMNLWKNLSNNYSKKKLFKAFYLLWIPHNPNVDSSDMQFSFPFICFKWKRKNSSSFWQHSLDNS